MRGAHTSMAGVNEPNSARVGLKIELGILSFSLAQA